MGTLSQNKMGFRKNMWGWIPGDWNLKRLKELTSKIGDGIHTTPVYIKESEYYFINGNNLINGKIIINKGTKCVSINEYYKFRKELTDKTILISINGTIGNIALYNDERVILGKSAAYINCNTNIHKSYLYYLLQTNRINRYFENELTGSTIRNLSLASIRETPIPVPPIPEQQKIAKILYISDKAIEKTEQLIQAKIQLKKGLMQQLLNGKKRFKEYEREEWKVFKLGDISKSLDNKRKPVNQDARSQMQGVIPYCGANGIVDYVNDYLFDEDIILIAEDGGYFEEFQTRPIAYRMKGKCWVNNHAHVLKAKAGFDQDFLFYSLVHKNIISYLNAGTRSKLNKSEMIQIEVYAPKNNLEQWKIGTLLNLVDDEIYILSGIKEEIMHQKKGLMQKLLSGELRV